MGVEHLRTHTACLPVERRPAEPAKHDCNMGLPGCRDHTARRHAWPGTPQPGQGLTAVHLVLLNLLLTKQWPSSGSVDATLCWQACCPDHGLPTADPLARCVPPAATTFGGPAHRRGPWLQPPFLCHTKATLPGGLGASATECRL